MANYINSKIYKIVNCIDDCIYVGSTTEPLRERFRKHKVKALTTPNRRLYSHLNNVGWNNSSIVLIELFACESKLHLQHREQYYIDLLKPSLNVCMPALTGLMVFESPEERTREQQRLYHIRNKEARNRRASAYYHINKQRFAEKVVCECGKSVSRSGLTAHKKTARHRRIMDAQ